MLYTSIDNEKIKDIKKLQTKKYRDLRNSFFIEGEHLVEEAYNAGLLETLIINEDINLSYENVEIIKIDNKVNKFLSELENAPKVMGVAQKKEVVSIGNRVLVLDGIQDPGNFGTIIRSAVAFNVDTILIQNTVDPYNSKVIRGSQGMLFKIDILECDLVSKINELKKAEYRVIGTDVNFGIELKIIEKKDKFVIIMGNEGNGVSSTVKSLSDEFIYIKMNEECESLNVGVASSIILYELNK